MWVGRWAQIGFVSSIIGEATTGHGTLQQVSVQCGWRMEGR